jgi:hypothetical protein
LTRCLLADPKGSARAEPGQNLQYTHPVLNSFKSIHRAFKRTRAIVGLFIKLSTVVAIECACRPTSEVTVLCAHSSTDLVAAHTTSRKLYLPLAYIFCALGTGTQASLTEHELLRVGTGTSRHRGTSTAAGRLALLDTRRRDGHWRTGRLADAALRTKATWEHNPPPPPPLPPRPGGARDGLT